MNLTYEYAKAAGCIRKREASVAHKGYLIGQNYKSVHHPQNHHIGDREDQNDGWTVVCVA